MQGAHFLHNAARIGMGPREGPFFFFVTWSACQEFGKKNRFIYTWHTSSMQGDGWQQRQEAILPGQEKTGRIGERRNHFPMNRQAFYKALYHLMDLWYNKGQAAGLCRRKVRKEDIHVSLFAADAK